MYAGKILGIHWNSLDKLDFLCPHFFLSNLSRIKFLVMDWSFFSSISALLFVFHLVHYHLMKPLNKLETHRDFFLVLLYKAICGWSDESSLWACLDSRAIAWLSLSYIMACYYLHVYVPKAD